MMNWAQKELGLNLTYFGVLVCLMQISKQSMTMDRKFWLAALFDVNNYVIEGYCLYMPRNQGDHIVEKTACSQLTLF